MSMNTQLADPANFNVDNMIFSKPVKGGITSGEGQPEIKFFRIPISARNADGSVGELVFPTPTELWSFGVQENLAQDGSGKVSGYSLPLCLYTKDNPQEIQKRFVSTLEAIVEKCKDHLLLPDVKAETGKYDLERAELKKLNSFIWWKREKGVIVPGSSPVLYPKLIQSKKQDNKIITTFFNQNGEDVDPIDLIGKGFNTTAAIKIESIFIGAKIALQIKVLEAEVHLQENRRRTLLARPKAESTVIVGENNPLLGAPASVSPSKIPAASAVEIEDDETGSEIEDDVTPAPPPPQPQPQPQPEAAPARKPVQKVSAAKKK